MIIAVDGPTASGKGTLSKSLAAYFELPFMDTGLLYRAVGRQVQLDGGDPDDSADALAGCGFADSLLEDAILRTEEIGGLASRVSIHSGVRAALNARQVNFANQPGGAILDGRDIGTVIAPHADVKLFVTASAEVRADRRLREMLSHGIDTDLNTMLADIHARDKRDAGRSEAPLKPALDSILIDTSTISADDALQMAITAISRYRAERHSP